MLLNLLIGELYSITNIIMIRVDKCYALYCYIVVCQHIMRK